MDLGHNLNLTEKYEKLVRKNGDIIFLQGKQWENIGPHYKEDMPKNIVCNKRFLLCVNFLIIFLNWLCDAVNADVRITLFHICTFVCLHFPLILQAK